MTQYLCLEHDDKNLRGLEVCLLRLCTALIRVTLAPNNAVTWQVARFSLEEGQHCDLTSFLPKQLSPSGSQTR